MFFLLLFIPSLISVDITADKYTASYKNMIQLITLNNLHTNAVIVNAIYNAARRYDLDPVDMTAIAIVESRMNTKALRHNSNGTSDVGLFQINTVNHVVCAGNLHTTEGNALCAARLLARHKLRYADYVGVYHSKTPKYKRLYMSRIATVKQFLSHFQKFDTRLASTSY